MSSLLTPRGQETGTCKSPHHKPHQHHVYQPALRFGVMHWHKNAVAKATQHDSEPGPLRGEACKRNDIKQYMICIKTFIIYLELSPPIFTEEAIEVEAGKDRAQKAAGGI